jgi:hypothetical protein
MSNIKVCGVAVIAWALVLTTLACSKPSPAVAPSQPAAAAPAQPQSGAATASQPAQSQASQPPASEAQQAAPPAATDPPRSASNGGGTPAKEKYHLGLTNYSGVAITVSANGEWLGQWDSHADVPLQPVYQGKNTLTVEIPSEPKNAVTVTIYTDRDGQRVNLLTLNFQGKSGTQNFFFVAK